MLCHEVRPRTLTYFVREGITVWLTSCLTGQDSAALLVLNQKKIYKFGSFLGSQTGGQLYSDTSPYNLSECSQGEVTITLVTPIKAAWVEDLAFKKEKDRYKGRR